jgi:hypothetical protein
VHRVIARSTVLCPTYRGEDKPYTLPPWTEEDACCLLKWLSTHTAEDGKHGHPDHEHERGVVEQQLRLAEEHGLTVQPGVYLPRSEQPQKQRKPRKERTREVA